jgi:hypothetical protein
MKDGRRGRIRRARAPFIGDLVKKTIIACVAVALLVGTTSATAASLITGKQIQDGSVGGRDVRDASLRGRDVKNGTLLRRDLSKRIRALLDRAEAQGVAGPAPGAKGDAGSDGAKGDAGVSGATGAKGDTGAAGAAGAKGDPGANGVPGADGVDGADGQKGDKGDRGENADGSTTTDVAASGDADWTIDTPAGSGGDNGVATLTADDLRLQITAPGGGFADARRPLSGQLAALTALVYKHATASPGSARPLIKLDIANASPCDAGEITAGVCTTPAFSGGRTTLVYEPVYSTGNDPVADTLGAGNMWWSTRDVHGATGRDTYVNGLQALQSIIANNPNATIEQIHVQAGMNSQGAPWSGFDGTVDWIRVGDTRFDFGS